jgi:hypothetical protein
VCGGAMEFRLLLIELQWVLTQICGCLAARSSLTVRPAADEAGCDGAWNSDSSFRDASL